MLLVSSQSYLPRQLHPLHVGHWSSPEFKSRWQTPQGQAVYLEKMELAIKV